MLLLSVGIAASALLRADPPDADLRERPTAPVGAADVRNGLGVATFVFAVLTGVYAYRKQLLSEGDARREDERFLSSRFESATAQMGDEAAAVRLAGVYALAALADDWPARRALCVDVLCAYMRLPYPPDAVDAVGAEAERQVRLALLKSIRARLRHTAAVSWQGLNMSFERAELRGGDLTGAQIVDKAYVSFHGATFREGYTFDSTKSSLRAVTWISESPVAQGRTFNSMGRGCQSATGRQSPIG